MVIERVVVLAKASTVNLISLQRFHAKYRIALPLWLYSVALAEDSMSLPTAGLLIVLVRASWLIELVNAELFEPG